MIQTTAISSQGSSSSSSTLIPVTVGIVVSVVIIIIISCILIVVIIRKKKSKIRYSYKAIHVYIMLNKDTPGVKKCKVNKKQPYLCVTKSFEVKKSPIKDIFE